MGDRKGWYVQQGTKVEGPISTEIIRDWRRKGLITDQTPVSPDGKAFRPLSAFLRQSTQRDSQTTTAAKKTASEVPVTITCWSCQKSFSSAEGRETDGFAFCPDCGAENAIGRQERVIAPSAMAAPPVDRHTSDAPPVPPPDKTPIEVPAVAPEPPVSDGSPDGPKGTADQRPRKKCPYCAELIFEEASVCRFCNRELAVKPQLQAIGDESLAQAMLVVPILGCLLIWFWVGSMNLLQGPGSSLTLVGLGTILVTAGLAAVDAKRLGIGNPNDPQKGSSPVAWFAFVAFLWIVGYPAYLFRRKIYGARSYLVAAILVALLFSGSWWTMASAIEEQQEKIRSILRR